MDRATWSRCNCMLIECASEYGIRMEAIQFDIPFCLRPPSLRSRHPPLPLVISSSPMHLLPDSTSSDPSSSSSSAASSSSISLSRLFSRFLVAVVAIATREDFSPSTLHEIPKKIPSLFVSLFHARSFLVPRLPLCIDAHNVHSCNPLRGISRAYIRDMRVYTRVYACVREHAAELMRHSARRGTLG